MAAAEAAALLSAPAGRSTASHTPSILSAWRSLVSPSLQLLASGTRASLWDSDPCESTRSFSLVPQAPNRSSRVTAYFTRHAEGGIDIRSSRHCCSAPI